jgi:predicted nucleic acid-binding protein
LSFIVATDQDDLFIRVLTLGELYRGVALSLAKDKMKAECLDEWVKGLEATFADRLLGVDQTIASVWSGLSAERSLRVIGTLIAATAIVHGLTMVTRNTRDFQATGVAMLNPWL